MILSSFGLVPQYLSFRTRVTIFEDWSKLWTSHGPPDTGREVLMPFSQAPFAPPYLGSSDFIKCEGRMFVNRLCQSLKGLENVTTTVFLSAPWPVTLSIWSKPAVLATSKPFEVIDFQRYSKSSELIGVPSDQTASGLILNVTTCLPLTVSAFGSSLSSSLS